MNARILFLTALIPCTFLKAASAEHPHIPRSITIDKTKEVGEIPFASTVTQTGATTCTVPIEVYPGIKDMHPQLAITYNHLSGNGPLGNILAQYLTPEYDGKNR
jgi:hypothetical protein